jgi:tetratricopeptide (TPR) repeat protein
MAGGWSFSWSGDVRITVVVLALLAAAPAAARARGGEPAACDLTGPAGDFWPKVVRDWSRRLPSLNAGPSQTPAWVSLIYGDAQQGSADFEKFIRRWAGVQEWNWVRSEIWKRPYSRLAGAVGGRLALKQNLILVGTPSSNPLIGEVLRRVKIRVEPESVGIGDRLYTGSDLLLIAILPSPYFPGKYVLCVLGFSEESLRRVTHLPFGESDYALFRGRKPLESGFFEKPRCDSWAPGRRPTVTAEYRGWEDFEIGTLRYRYDPSRTPRSEVEALALRESRQVEEMSRTLRLPRGTRRIEIYLYASADDKARETGLGSPVHLNEETGSVHRVFVKEETAPYQIVTLKLRQDLGGRGSPGLRLALALAASPEFEGRPLEEYGARLASTGRFPDLDRLAAMDGNSLDPDSQQTLPAASFLHFLISEGRIGDLKQLYLNSSARDPVGQFHSLLGESLEKAQRRWARSWNASPGEPAPGSGVARSPRSPGEFPSEAGKLLELGTVLFRDRRDREAQAELESALRIAPHLSAARLLLARIAFRAGDTETAIREAKAALESSRDPEILAWAHVTLGRAEALRGRRSAAALELRDPAVAGGPEAPRLVADLWLENLSLSPNRKAVEEQLRFEAKADLQNFDWDAAEKKLKAVLAANPDDAAAHFALSDVYLKHHDYWVERANLSNELHPATTPLDPALYKTLADRAERELEKGVVLSTPGMFRPGGERPPGERGRGGPLDDLDLYDPSLKARSDSPEERHSRFFLGRTYFLAGDLPRARQEIGRSLGQDAYDPRFAGWSYVYLGFIELLEGRRSTAKAYFEAARRMRLGGRVTAAAKKGLALADAPGRP